jgi:uncharacterized protein YndB with AHSA1/START domain
MTTIVKSAFFAAPPPVVWSFLTNADKLATWYYQGESDLADGNEYRLLKTEDDGSTSVIVWGHVLEMIPYSRLVTTFTITPLGGNETKLTWELEEVLGGTRLYLEHSGVASAAGVAALGLLQGLDTGWDKHFARLRDAVKSSV